MTDSPHVSIQRFVEYLLRGVPLTPEEQAHMVSAMCERKPWCSLHLMNSSAEGLNRKNEDGRYLFLNRQDPGRTRLPAGSQSESCLRSPSSVWLVPNSALFSAMDRWDHSIFK